MSRTTRITKKRLVRATCLIASLSFTLMACSPSPKELPKTETSTPEKDSQTSVKEKSALPDPSSSQLTLELEKILAESLTKAAKLKASTELFLATPSEQTHAAVLDDFNQAHDAYRLAALALFLSAEDDPSETAIDAFPMLPGYLDAVDGYPNSGLIHSEMLIDLKTMQEEHQFSDELYLTLGFHPFEFILKGDPSSPIAAWRRFELEGTEKHKTAAQRRSAYLLLLADTLQTSIQNKVNQWRETNAIRLAYLNDQRVMDSYLENEAEHTGELGAERIKTLWQSLIALQTQSNEAKTEVEPENTSPSDSLSQE